MSKKSKKLSEADFTTILALALHKERQRTDAKIAALADCLKDALDGFRLIMRGEAENRIAKLRASPTPEAARRSLVEEPAPSPTANGEDHP